MRVAIDNTAAVNQTAGIGRFVRALDGALAAIDQVTQYLLVHATPNGAGLPILPTGPNFSSREIKISQRYLDFAWHRLQLPIPATLFSGPVDLFLSPEFVLPPIRGARTLLTVHDLAFLLL